MLQMKVVLRPGGGGPEPAEGVSEPKPTGGSTDPKTFIAMRARQKIVEARVRLVKRVLLCSVAAGAAATWFAYPPQAPAPALAKGPAPAAVRSPAPRAFATLEEAVAVLNEPEGAAVEAGPVANFPTHRSPVVHTRAATATAATAATATATAATTLGATCATDFETRRWRAAIGSCESAFAETPDPALALRVAHSYWSSGQPAPAGSWAAKALELGTRDADAFVLIGHAERKAGNPQSAIRAYQQYLESSPRGWHARRVRAALRQLEAKVLSQRPNPRPVDTGPSRGQL